ncbi:MAG: ATP-binding protein [Pyrinomonadaceae bacterium]|nr:ATP-binding protein [Pyrinomonadaceae bacterium]
MNLLKLNLENCYGIKKLETNFDFSALKTIAVYAPNGVMKTSLAKAFRDLSRGEESRDLIYPDRKTLRDIRDENDVDIAKEDVFVVLRYSEEFSSERMSSLVARKELKKEYDLIQADIDDRKKAFLKVLKPLSGLSGYNDNIELAIEKAFKGEFFDVLEEVKADVISGFSPPFSEVRYAEIFDDKILAFLNTKDFRGLLKEYIEKYDELIQNSKYLKKGFNHYNALTIHTNLLKHGFFHASHSLNLYDGISKTEISDADTLEETIRCELESVLNDQDLKKRFDEIDKRLTNDQLRGFRNYLFDHKELLTELADLDNFAKNIWISYFIKEREIYLELMKQYEKGKQRIIEIAKLANDEQTEWERVVRQFNERFTPPFRVFLENKRDSILKGNIPSLGFDFHDFSNNNGKKLIDRTSLLEVLSEGEKRAFYLLNIIFEVEARKKLNSNTVFIVDDIADSFDYKNKYAIVEYLKEISTTSNFNQLILTHNFDFFRTIQGRILGNARWKNSFVSQRDEEGIVLVKGGSKNVCNPFSNWRKSINDDQKVVIATIPFARNLFEFKDGNKSPEFLFLTHLLHQKPEKEYKKSGCIVPETKKISLKDLKEVVEKLISNVSFDKFDLSMSVIDIIYRCADELLTSPVPNEIVLENKIVLSIAIRLRAEEYILSKISDQSEIKESQTGILVDRFKREFGSNPKQFEAENKIIPLLNRVNLITPENIHINSFMYEPILDMSDNHLKSLYSDIVANCSVKVGN